MGPDAMILVFWMLSFKPTFSLSSFTFIKRLFSFSLLSAIRVMSSAYPGNLESSLCFIQPGISHDVHETFDCLFVMLLLLLLLSRFSVSTLCNPIDGSPPGSTVPGILQAKTLEWVAISFSSAWKRKVKVKPLSRVRLFVTPWSAAHQAPPSMGFSRQEYWSGVPLPSPLCDVKVGLIYPL